MYGYRLDDAQGAQQPQPAPQSYQQPQLAAPSYQPPQPAPTPVPAPRRKRRVGTAALLGLALTGGAIGGGAAGAAATARWFTPPTSAGTVVAAQPIAQTPPVAPDNIAGAVYRAVGPSIVEINVQSQVRRGLTPSGSGTGFVVDAGGLVITNNHVVSGSSNVSVTFSNGETRSAQVVGTDSSNDLALLRVETMPSGIPAVTLGDSSTVEVGETAIAIGSPFGLEQTVTQGIVSAVERNWSSTGPTLRGLIQTDAPINPGNSGGPLLNARGEVIGITTLIESPVRGNVGVGFAVPVNIVKQQLDQLESGANLQQGYLGVTSDPTAVDPDQPGVTIQAVEAGSGAAQAGMQPGDIISAIDGNAVTDYESLVGQLSGKQPGETLTVTVVRNGQEQEFEVTLQARTTNVG
jgi:S1-C subfamily serine protease